MANVGSLSTVGSSPLGTGSGQAGRVANQLQGSYYPSPFFDIANTYLPSSIKSLFRFCAYYVSTNPIVANAIYRMAEFPITDLIISSGDEILKSKWSEILEDNLDIKTTLIEIGLNYQTFGNVFLSVYLPFKRYLVCQSPGCKKPSAIESVAYEYRQFQFRGTCEHCGESGVFRPEDRNIRKPEDINIIFWDPNNIDIEYNPVTGKRVYKYNIPNDLKRTILTGHPRRVLNATPTLFIDAVKQKKVVVFDSNEIFHIRRPALAGKEMGWGHPVLMGVLKYLFVLQLFIKAREVIAHNYILPLWVLFPQSYNNENPFELLNMDRWQQRVTQEILKWRQDNAYIPILPLPIGFQHIGGQGAQLSVVPEIQNITDDILTGLLVPKEFVRGGLSYSGTSITIRMLENQFQNLRGRSLRFVKWLQKKISKFLEIKAVPVKMTDLRMADDVQRKSLAANLASQRKLPWAKVQADWGETPDDINEQIDKEMKRDLDQQVDLMKNQAKAQGEAQIISAKYAYKVQLYQEKLLAEAQRDLVESGTMTEEEARANADRIRANGGLNIPPDAMNQMARQARGEYEAGDHSPPGQPMNFTTMDPQSVIDGWAQQLLQLDEGTRNQLLSELSEGNQVQSAVAQRAIEMLTATDMRPLPDQLPPRRQGAVV